MHKKSFEKCEDFLKSRLIFVESIDIWAFQKNKNLDSVLYGGSLSS